MTREFDFIRIPKELFRNPYYTSLSPEGKLLYGFLLDRASLSWASGEKWRTPDGDPFVIFTIEEICQRLCCGKGKAITLLKKLEDSKLIQRSRPKKDGPYHIIVKPFQNAVPKPDLPKFEKQTWAGSEMQPQQVGKPDLNKTDNNKTEMNNTDTTTVNWEYEIKKNIDYDILSSEYPKDKLDAIVEVMTDAARCPSPTQWVGGQPRPTKEIQKRLLEADCMRIRYIFDHMKRSTGTIQSYRAYYLSRLWEPEGMVDAFYEAWVRHDGTC